MQAPPIPPRPEQRNSLSATTAPYTVYGDDPTVDPTQKRAITQDDVDAQGRLPLRHRFHHISHLELNKSSKSCGPIPSASRLPDARLTVLVLGAEGPYGSHVMRGLTNAAYACSFNVQSLELESVLQCRDANQLADRLRGAHTVVSTDCYIVQEGGEYVDRSDDALWHRLLDACRLAKVKRFVASPFDWDLQLAHPPKKNHQSPVLIRRALERRKLLTEQKKLPKEQQIDYVLISVGLLTEQLFSPLCGVDVQGGVVRAPASLGLDTRITTTTLDDVARMLPEVLLSSASHNAIVHLASSAVTYDEIALLIEQATGNRVRREEVQLSDAQRQEAAREDTRDASATMAVLLEESGGLWWIKGNSWNAGYIPHVQATTIRDWAARHLKQPNSSSVESEYQPNMHTTHTGLAPMPPTPAQLYFSVAT